MRPTADWLRPVVTVITENLDILPAVGGAVEELERFDIDEIEDTLPNNDTKLVPAAKPATAELHRKRCPSHRHFRDDFQLSTVVGCD